jgi:hypothetical protein
MVCESGVTVGEALLGFGNPEEGNVSHCKPLPDNTREDKRNASIVTPTRGIELRLHILSIWALLTATEFHFFQSWL